MAQFGSDAPEFRNFVAEGSGNGSGNGMFSFQVTSKLMKRHTILNVAHAAFVVKLAQLNFSTFSRTKAVHCFLV
jgi:hypothetical protein